MKGVDVKVYTFFITLLEREVLLMKRALILVVFYAAIVLVGLFGTGSSIFKEKDVEPVTIDELTKQITNYDEVKWHINEVLETDNADISVIKQDIDYLDISGNAEYTLSADKTTFRIVVRNREACVITYSDDEMLYVEAVGEHDYAEEEMS
jgi:hypothetical protein